MLVGKGTLKFKYVKTILLEIDKIKKPTNHLELGAFLMNSDQVMVKVGHVGRMIGRSQDQNLDRGRNGFY